MALAKLGSAFAEFPLDIVAAMTGILPDDEHYPLARLIDDISSSVKSDKPLPADPIAASLLAASIREAATERQQDDPVMRSWSRARRRG